MLGPECMQRPNSFSIFHLSVALCLAVWARGASVDAKATKKLLQAHPREDHV